MSEPSGLSPSQLRSVARKIRGRYSPPAATMNAAVYVSHEAMTALAWALESLADEDDKLGS